MTSWPGARAISNAYFELAHEGEDVSAELRREVDRLRALVDKLETETLLSGDNDDRNAIVTIHPGAGGTESQDWAEMLMRMYMRWAERQGFSTQLYEYQPGDEAGIKSATFGVNGEYAYGLLTSEIGVHRLVRISPFDQAKRRHTSFASVLSRRRSTRASRSTSSRKTFASIRIARAARAGSTSTPRIRRCASRIFRRGSWSPARTSARNTRTARRR